jgi:hypothetical protein
MKTKFYKATNQKAECTFNRRENPVYLKVLLNTFNYRLIFLSFLFLMNGFLQAQDFSKTNLVNANKMNSALIKKDSGSITFYTLPGEPNIRMIIPKVSGNTGVNNSKASSNKNHTALNSVLSAPTCLSAPLYPADGQTGVCPNYTISWSSVSGATGYKVYLGGENGTNPPYWMTRTDNSMTFFSPENYLIYWKIVPVNNDGEATGCPLWTFTTGVFTRSSVQLTVSPGTSVCEGTPVTFTAIPTNGGSNPQYRWWNGYTNDRFGPQRNYIDGETGPTLTLSNIPNGNKIGVEMLYDPDICTLGSFTEVTMTTNPAVVWYLDADNDGYSDGATQTQCERPADYKPATELTATNGDCDDGNATINPATVWYQDADNDGYSDGATQTQCERPADYKLATELTAISGDCDDGNAAINPATVWYKDVDNDGYSDGTTQTQCTRPADYKLATELTATSGDCDDNNAVLNPATVWFKDADNDGFSDGTTQTHCARSTGYKLASELTATSVDCNDNDASVHSAQTYYRDIDGDGYGSSTTTSVCSATPPAGYTTRTGDCNDNNPAINPGVVEVCGNGIDDNCNGQKDEQPCYVCQNATGLTTTSISSSSATLNWNAVANPVQWQVQYKTTNQGAKWVDVPGTLTGNLRSVTIIGLKPKQAYNWHIRAKCGKTWTAYSGSVSFKTLGGTQFAIDQSSATENISNLRLYPNPSKGQFLIELHVAEKLSANVKIQLIDMTGKAVQTENAEINNGSLQKTISVSSTLTKGIYMVRIVVNNKIYKTQLVYTK